MSDFEVNIYNGEKATPRFGGDASMFQEYQADPSRSSVTLNKDEFMPVDIYDQLDYQDKRVNAFMKSPKVQYALDTLPEEDKAKEAAKMYTTFVMASNMGVTPEEVYTNYPVYARHIFGDEEPTNNQKALKDAYNYSKTSMRISRIGNLMANPDLTEEQVDRLADQANSLRATLPPIDNIKRTAFWKAAVASASQVPTQIEGVKAGIDPTLTYSNLLASNKPGENDWAYTQLSALGYNESIITNNLKRDDTINTIARTALPLAEALAIGLTAPASVPFSVLGGLGAVAATVSGMNFADIEAGSTMLDLYAIRGPNGERLSHKTISYVSKAAGLIKGAAEIFSESTIFRGIPALEGVFDKAFATWVGEKGLKSAIAKFGERALTRGVVTGITETGEEIFQQAVDDQTHNLMIELDKNSDLFKDQRYSKADVISHFYDTATQTMWSLGPYMILGGATKNVMHAWNTNLDVRTEVNKAIHESIQQAMAEVNNGNEIYTDQTKAPSYKRVVEILKENSRIQEIVSKYKDKEISSLESLASLEESGLIGKEYKITKEQIDAERSKMAVSDFDKMIIDDVRNGGGDYLDYVDPVTHEINKDSTAYKTALSEYIEENKGKYVNELNLTDEAVKKEYYDKYAEMQNDILNKPMLTPEEYKKSLESARAKAIAKYTEIKKRDEVNQEHFVKQDWEVTDEHQMYSMSGSIFIHKLDDLIKNYDEAYTEYQKQKTNYENLVKTGTILGDKSFEAFKSNVRDFNNYQYSFGYLYDAEKNLATLDPVADRLDEAIKNSDSDLTAFNKQLKELRRIISEAKESTRVSTVLDYKIEQKLLVEAIENDIKTLEEKGRQFDEGSSARNAILMHIKELQHTKFDLESNSKKLATTISIVAKDLYDKNKMIKNLEKTLRGIQEREDFYNSAEYEDFLDNIKNLEKLVDKVYEHLKLRDAAILGDPEIRNMIRDELETFMKSDQYAQFTQAAENEDVLDTYTKNEAYNALSEATRQGRRIQKVESFNKMLLSVMQKSLSNFLRINGERLNKSIHREIPMNVSKPRREYIQRIQRMYDLADGVNHVDIMDAREDIKKVMNEEVDEHGLPLYNAKEVAQMILNDLQITFDPNMILKKPAISIGTLADIKTTIDLQEYLGKIELQEAQKGIILGKEMLKSEFMIYQDKVFSKVSPDAIKRDLKKLRYAFRMPKEIAAKIFGKAGEQLYWHDAINASAKIKENMNIRTREIHEAIPGFQEEVKHFYDKLDEDVTVQDAMFYMMGRYDKHIFNHLVNGNGLDVKTMDRYIDMLLDKQKHIAKVLAKDLQDRYTELAASFERVNGIVLGYIEGYLPAVGVDAYYKDINQDIGVTILRGLDFKDRGVSKDFTYTRAMATPENAHPIRTDLFDLWQDYVYKQEQYIGMAEWGIRAKGLLNDKEVRSTIINNYGNEMYKMMTKYVQDVLSPSSLHATDIISQGARFLKHNLAMANLAFRVSVMARQLPSGLLYISKSGLGNWLDAQKQFIAGFYKDGKKLKNKVVEFVRENDQLTATSLTEYETLNYKHLEGLRAKKKILDEWGMKGIHNMDIYTKAVGWKAVYDKYFPIVGHDKAVEIAREHTVLTQPSSDKVFLPQAYRTNDIMNLALLYTQQPVKLLNYLIDNVPKIGKEGERMVGVYAITGIVLNNMIIYALAKREVPKDPKDWAIALGLGSVSWIPIFGKDMLSLIDRGYTFSHNQLTDPAAGVYNLLNAPKWKDAIEEAQNHDYKKLNSMLKSINSGAGVSFGLPSTAAKNAVITTLGLYDTITGEEE